MMKLIHIIVLIASLIATSCVDGKRQAPDWQTFATLSPTGDTLRGVLHGTDTIVCPDRYVKIEIDRHVIKAYRTRYSIMVFDKDGRLIRQQPFDTFTQWDRKEGRDTTHLSGTESRADSPDSVRYVGTDYRKTYYYYPHTRRLVELPDTQRVF